MVNICEARFEKREAQGLFCERGLTKGASRTKRCILILVAQDSMISCLVPERQQERLIRLAGVGVKLRPHFFRFRREVIPSMGLNKVQCFGGEREGFAVAAIGTIALGQAESGIDRLR